MKAVLLGFILGSMMSTALAQNIDLPIEAGVPTSAPRPVSTKSSDDCLVLKGALTVSAVMTTNFEFGGGFGVWKNIWQYNVGIGNTVSSDLENRVAPLLKNPANQQQLQNIAQELYTDGSAADRGHGFNYWPNAYQQQAQKLQSASENLHNLAQSACQ